MKKIFITALIIAIALSLFVVPSFAEEYLDRSEWTFKASSEIDGWGFIDRAFDGNTKTYWHTNYKAEGTTVTYKDPLPHTIEITLPKTTVISGIAYLPRQDAQSGHLTTYEVYISSTGTDKGELVTTVNIEDVASNNEVVTKFKKAYNAKKITIIVTKSAGVIGAAAEFNFIGGGSGSDTSTTSNSATSNDGATTEVVKVDKTGWTLTATSEMDGWGFVDRMADGNTKTYWHTKYVAEGSTIKSKDDVPHTVEITFPRVESISAMEYLPRQDQQSGRWIDIELYASESGTDKGTLIKKASFDHTKSELQTIDFGKTVKAKKVTLIVTKSAGGYGTCAEIDFLCKKEVTTDDVVEEKAENPYPEKFDTSDWIITTNSEKSWGKVERILDGDITTFWHTNYEEANGKVLSHDMPPYNVDITLPNLTLITGIKLTPRSDRTTGAIKKYRLYASREDEGEWSLLMEEKISSAYGTQIIDFACGIEVKRIRLEVLEGDGGYATLAELELIPGKADTLVVPYEDFNKTMNENKLHKIDPSTIKAENDLPTWANQNVGTIVKGGVWQTEEIQGGEPVIIAVDLGEAKKFSAISVYPRQSKDYHGYWLEFTIWASADGEEYFPIVENYSFPKRSLDEKYIYFDESVTARYVEIEVTKYSSYRVSCQGLYFWQTYEDMKTSSDSGKFTMQIGSNEIKVEKGDESYTKTIDVAPYITSAGSTLIPLRGLVEEMGAEIAWDGETQTIKLKKGLLEIELQIQNKLVYVEDPIYGHTMYTLTSAPRISDSRTFIPVRFVSEMLGYNVSWDGETKTITIEK